MAAGASRESRPGVPKAWGWETLWTLTRHYAGKVLHIRRGHQLSLRYHRQREESFLLRAGRLILVLEDAGGRLREHWLVPGDAQHVPPGRLHRLIALEDCELVVVSTPELDDVENLDDVDDAQNPVPPTSLHPATH